MSAQPRNLERQAVEAEDGALSRQLSGRMSAALYFLSGVVAITGPLIPWFPVLSRMGMIMVGIAAMISGVIVWFLPWEHWRRSRLLWLVPPAFLLIGLLNHFGGADPYRYSLFFMVAFIGVGIAHPSGTCLRFVPLMLIAYIVPLITAERYSPAAVSSVVYAAPVCLLAGETLSWVAERLRRAREAVRQTEARFRSLVMNASDMIVVVDASGGLLYVSPSTNQGVPGTLAAGMAGANVANWVHPDDIPHLHRFLDICSTRTETLPVAELRYRQADGAWRDVEVIGSNLLDDPNVNGIVITARDITERKALEHQLAHQAFHDPLTNLPNRALFADRTAHALTSIGRHFHGIAVLFVDLDRFKVVNDSLGHEVGDRLLAAIAERLQACVRQGDTVSRFGGDEFTLLLEHVSDISQATETAERIISALTYPFTFDAQEVHITASVGIVHSSSPHDEPHTLIRHADVAMYHAKKNGKAQYEVFDPSLDRNTLANLNLENDLRRAIERQEFVVHYQPKVSLDTGETYAVEALARWNHPERGTLSPQEFIPLAEETGLIVPIGRLVLQKACRQARLWQDEDPESPPLFVSVNLSARQLKQPDLADDIALILNNTGLAPEHLELEITESAMIEDSTVTLATFAKLKHLGVRLAVDDFGTGYSSFSYLKNFPLDVLKIDRSFVGGLGTGTDDAAIITAIIEIGHSLGLKVVAEGVETIEQLTWLRELGCDHGQGYYLAKPLSTEDAGAYLERSRNRNADIPRSA